MWPRDQMGIIEIEKDYIVMSVDPEANIQKKVRGEIWRGLMWKSVGPLWCLWRKNWQRIRRRLGRKLWWKFWNGSRQVWRQVGASTSINPMKTVQESFGSFLKTPVKNSSGSSTSTSTNSTLPKSLDDWFFHQTSHWVKKCRTKLRIRWGCINDFFFLIIIFRLHK